MAQDSALSSAQAIRQRIIAKMALKGVGSRPCPLCGHLEWNLGSYVPLSISPSPTDVNLGGKLYPSVTLFCRNCGNTHIINLFNLGFTEQEIITLRVPEEDA